MLERLVDAAARVSGIDRLELRRRNLIRPDRMPYKTPVGTTYDSGDFPALFETALERADVAHFKQRAEAAQRAGKRRGLGVACFLEIAGGQPGEGAVARVSRREPAAARDRRAGERPGPSHALSPARRRTARHSGRTGRFRAGRQRRRRAERRRGRLALDDVGRRRARRGDRRGDREGPPRRRPSARSRRGRHRLPRRRVRDRRHRPTDRAVRPRRAGPRARRRPGRSPRISTRAAPPTCRRPFRTACMSPKSRSTPIPGM